jgi:hypothetical protein
MTVRTPERNDQQGRYGSGDGFEYGQNEIKPFQWRECRPGLRHREVSLNFRAEFGQGLKIGYA